MDRTIEQDHSCATPQKRFRNRRKLVINPRQQITGGVATALVSTILLGLLNLSIYFYSLQIDAIVTQLNPQLDGVIESQMSELFRLLVPTSIIFVFGVFLVTIIDSHRTAGAAFSICRKLEELRDGSYGENMVLRKDDNLREIEAAVNEATDALRTRTLEDIETLQKLAEDIEQAKLAGPALANSLHKFADEKRKHLD